MHCVEQQWSSSSFPFFGWGNCGLGMNTAVDPEGVSAGNCLQAALLTAEWSPQSPWLPQWVWMFSWVKGGRNSCGSTISSACNKLSVEPEKETSVGGFSGKIQLICTQERTMYWQDMSWNSSSYSLGLRGEEVKLKRGCLK